MNVAEFQKKLNGVLELAKKNHNKISSEKVEQYFQGDMLSREQLESIFDYLSGEHIQIPGRGSVPGSRREDASQEPSEKGEKELPDWAEPKLSPEEETYAQEYIRSLGEGEDLGEEQRIKLFEKMASGDDLAKRRLIQWFLPIVAETARILHHPQVFIGDAIQEGNVSLLLALEEPGSSDEAEKQVREAVRRGIISLVEEQTEQKRRDKEMVNKVKRLERAIKDLTDEEGKIEFSVDELALFLDMPREEIEDILRLAGEDK